MGAVLVTGGAGFLGAYLVEKLIEADREVIIVDIELNTGAVSYVNPKAIFIRKDITDPSLYDELEDWSIDTIFHLAAQSAGEPSYSNPQSDLFTNALGSLMLARFAESNKVKQIIYTSTVAVYGSLDNSVLDETSPIKPDSFYGVSKYTGEQYIRTALAQSKNTRFSIFRVFNTYGPGENLMFMQKGMVSIYLSYIFRGENVCVKGSLERFRDFTFVTDTVRALILAMDNDRAENQVFNLTAGHTITVRELLENIFDVFQIDGWPVTVLPGTPGDSFGFSGSAAKLNAELGWIPHTNLKEGLLLYKNWLDLLSASDELKHPFDLK